MRAITQERRGGTYESPCIRTREKGLPVGLADRKRQWRRGLHKRALVRRFNFL